VSSFVFIVLRFLENIAFVAKLVAVIIIRLVVIVRA